MFVKPVTEGFLATYLPGFVRFVTRLNYGYISRMDRRSELLCLNYGYHDATYDVKPLQLPAMFQAHRYQVQMYDHVARAVSLEGLDVLEVGSGRGGGAGYLAGHFSPRSFVGLDLAKEATDFCRRHYDVPGLSFRSGNAELLPFASDHFDVVLNVESALDYPRVERFYSEVARVLKPGGYFLYADIRYFEEMPTWRRQLREQGLDQIGEEDITPHVRKALALDYDRKLQLVAAHVPWFLRGHFGDFAGLSGAGLYRDQPENGTRVYLNFVFRKRG